VGKHTGAIDARDFISDIGTGSNTASNYKPLACYRQAYIVIELTTYAVMFLSKLRSTDDHMNCRLLRLRSQLLWPKSPISTATHLKAMRASSTFLHHTSFDARSLASSSPPRTYHGRTGNDNSIYLPGRPFQRCLK
jgi:hypothetical protein